MKDKDSNLIWEALMEGNFDWTDESDESYDIEGSRRELLALLKTITTWAEVTQFDEDHHDSLNDITSSITNLVLHYDMETVHDDDVTLDKNKAEDRVWPDDPRGPIEQS